MRWMFTAVVLVLLTGAGSHAFAAKYHCNSSAAEARIGVADEDRVVIDGDDDKKICSFAVNKHDAGSPPGIDQAWKDFDEGLTDELSKGDVQALAVVLLSASFDVTVPSDLESLLRNNSKGLANCLESFRIGKLRPDVDELRNEKEGIICRFIDPRNADMAKPMGSITIDQTAMTYAVIGTRVSNHTRILFLPYTPR